MGAVAPDVSVVIVSWRVRAHLQRCLQALPAAMGDLSYEVIVVDNDSGDGTVEMVRRLFPDVRLVVNERNLLYTAGANQGLALASGRYALLLNPDMVPHPHSVARLVEYAEAHPKAGLMGPRIFDASGRDDWRTGRDFPTPWSEFVDWSGLGRFSFLPFLVKNRRLSYDRKRTEGAPLLSGACLLLSPRLSPPLRYFDPIFSMYGEDIDLCRRVQQAGFSVVLAADARMTHIGGASSRQRPVASALMAVDAMNLYFEIWNGRRAAWLHRALLGLAALFKTSVFCPLCLVQPAVCTRCQVYRHLLRWAVCGWRKIETQFGEIFAS